MKWEGGDRACQCHKPFESEVYPSLVEWIPPNKPVRIIPMLERSVGFVCTKWTEYIMATQGTRRPL